jgi:endogenous inhibitor of DNA gyrase (YacG/DUF329 family)
LKQQTKKCSRCGDIKPLTEFSRNQRNPDGYQYHCKACARKEWKRYQSTRPKVIATCLECGNDFERTNGNFRYCPDCRIKVCPQCGKEFSPKSGNHAQVCCSRRCAALFDSARIERLVSNRGPGRPRSQRTHICLVCGKAFQYVAYRDAKYCSQECWNVRGEKTLVQCAYCGKEKKVLVCTLKSGRNKYCSKRCYDLDKREQLKGQKSHLWEGGKTKASALARTRAKYREWRRAVFARDDYSCQRCGARSSKGKTVYLHAHHIKHFSTQLELRYDLSNGITLCEDCHTLEHNHKFVHKRKDQSAHYNRLEATQ